MTHSSTFGRWPRLLVVVLAAALASGCDSEGGESLFDPDRQFRPDPSITSVDPPSALAGIGSITIVGENFSSDPSENLVFFDDVRVTVLEASPTQLTVASPNLPKDDVRVRVNVLGAEHFSNTLTVKLEPAVEEFGAVKEFEEPFAITTDAEGNLYVSLFANAASAGIQRIGPDGVRQAYVATTFKWDALALHDDGYLYGVRGVQAIFRFPPGGGAQENWAILSDRSARLRALVFDEEGNAWAGGRGGNIYRIDPQVNITPFPFPEDVEALAIYDGFLYAATADDEEAAVWRFPITEAGLGSAEKYFSITEQVGIGIQPLSLAFTAGGDLFVGTDAEDPLLLVGTDGSWTYFYPGLLRAPAFSLAWGDGVNLFMAQTDSDAGPGRIVRINTQREGSR